MVILAPEQGSRTTLTPDPRVPVGDFNILGGAFNAALQAPWLAGGAAAIGVAAALRAMQQKTADAAAAAAAAIQGKAAGKFFPENFPGPKLAPPSVPPAPIPRVPHLPPLPPLPVLPARQVSAAPVAGAAGGLMLVLVAVGLLSGMRRR